MWGWVVWFFPDLTLPCTLCVPCPCPCQVVTMPDMPYASCYLPHHACRYTFLPYLCWEVEEVTWEDCLLFCPLLFDSHYLCPHFTPTVPLPCPSSCPLPLYRPCLILPYPSHRRMGIDCCTDFMTYLLRGLCHTWPFPTSLIGIGGVPVPVFPCFLPRDGLPTCPCLQFCPHL